MLIFHTLRYKNFLSSGNAWNQYALDAHPTTLIVGQNGAGKTTMLDALCMGLYGKGFRNINRGNFVNSINEKQMVVEIEFTAQNDRYLVRRGIKPAIFDIICNGTPLPAFASSAEAQDYLEKYILQCNYKAFTQVVILGASSYVPFMRLTPAARREILEDLLDIEVFSVMQSLAKDRLSNTKDALNRSQSALSLAESQHAMAESYNARWVEQQERQRAQIDTQLTAIDARVSTLEAQRDALASVDELAAIAEKIPDYTEKHSRVLRVLAKLDADAQQHTHYRGFFASHDQCPTCHQSIESTFKERQVADASVALETLAAKRLEAVALSETLERKLHAAQDARRTIQYVTESRARIAEQLRGCGADRTRLHEERLRTFDAPPDPPSELGDLDALRDKVARYTYRRQVQEQTVALLKDTGIRTRIIQQYLPVINKWVNHYLHAMNFPVQFLLDEQFNETIKSRHRDEFSYENFSEGEKRRIDLALVLTWRTVARMKNSVYTNLLIFDEVFDSSLDSSGTDDFLALLQTMSTETNTFVISHKTDVLIDRFAHVVVVTKERGFSVVS